MVIIACFSYCILPVKQKLTVVLRPVKRANGSLCNPLPFLAKRCLNGYHTILCISSIMAQWRFDIFFNIMNVTILKICVTENNLDDEFFFKNIVYFTEII